MLLAAIMLFVLVGAKVPYCEDEPRYVLYIYHLFLSVISLCLVELMRGEKYNIKNLSELFSPSRARYPQLPDIQLAARQFWDKLTMI